MPRDSENVNRSAVDFDQPFLLKEVIEFVSNHTIMGKIGPVVPKVWLKK